MATLPQLVQRIDNFFVQTWYDIKKEAEDNILLGTPVWALLKERGRLINQNGSNLITETIRYDVPPGVAIAPGHVFTPGTRETRTMARWNWRFVGMNVSGSLFEDVENYGKYKIDDYTRQRTEDARDGLLQKFERVPFNPQVTDESGLEMQSLNDVVPISVANAQLGTYGGIARPTAYAAASATDPTQVPSAGNTFWGPKYLAGTAPAEINIEADMEVLYNSLHANQVRPDIFITDKYLIEVYAQFTNDKTQLVKNEGSMTANLGYTTYKYKGGDLTWTPNITPKHMLMLTSASIKVMYDSNMWFEPTGWKQVPDSLDRYNQIMCRGNIICKQPRRNGRLIYT